MAAEQPTHSGRVVVIGIDDSEFSEYAFNFYIANIYRAGDLLVIVHCMEFSSVVHALFIENVKHADDKIVLVMVPELCSVIASPGILTDPIVVSELMKEEDAKLKSLIHKYSEKMKHVHLGGKVKQMTGKVGEAIIEAAKEENASMIVVGTRGMGTVRRTLMGSVSDFVVHHSPVPVLVCRHKDHHHDRHHGHHSKH